MSWRNVETARRCFARFGARDVDGFLELLDPEVEWVPAISVVGPDQLAFGTYQGHEGVRQWFADVEQWSDYRVEANHFRRTGEHALVTGRVFFARNGEEHLFDVYFVFTINDRKVISMRTFADEQPALEAAGLEDALTGEA
jgi:ketosteroid isomerase-like protein